jgi:hypothetical protein
LLHTNYQASEHYAYKSRQTSNVTLSVEVWKYPMINQSGSGISTPPEQGIKQAANGGRTNHGINAGLESKEGDERGDAGYQDGRLESPVKAIRPEHKTSEESASLKKHPFCKHH